MTAVILYARVSTPSQAERELSIPAQLRLMQRYSEEYGFAVVAKYQDVSSGKFPRGRPGLLAAIGHAKRDKLISGLVVHKIDRLSRNTFNYLVLKGKLRDDGVRIYSVVESFEASPMGEFLEHIMAAQAEFYSANLASEVRKGLEERLLRGKWTGVPPLGYLVRDNRIVLDPARATLVRTAFELWAKGDIIAKQLADEVYNRGLVGVHGKKIEANQWCRLLKNPFYTGMMVVNDQSYPGTHPILVSKELFDRCQTIFQQKVSGVRSVRKHLVFVLAGKVKCPRCASILTGERHVKKSGKTYDYYRCHQRSCRFVTRAKELDDLVCKILLEMNLPEKLLPILWKKIRGAKRERDQRQAERIRGLRQRRRELEEQLGGLGQLYADHKVSSEDYDRQQEMIRNEIRATEWLLGRCADVVTGDDESVQMMRILEGLPHNLENVNPVTKRKAADAVVSWVSLACATPALELRAEFATILREATLRPARQVGPMHRIVPLEG